MKKYYKLNFTLTLIISILIIINCNSILESDYPTELAFVEANEISQSLDYKVLIYTASQDPLDFSATELKNISSYLELMTADISLTTYYDENYFQKSNLLIFKTWESSGSNQLRVSSLILQDQILTINIDQIVYPIGTTDMRFWYLLIEYDKPDQLIEKVVYNKVKINV